ncbi:gluconolactonase [Sphingomonas paeninsulae]|uniref:Gluconolactonase n=1 Tax=Sphingomonas paeninsulae TaxID=2319844 RepID=A0A494T8I1_SPHPE|nr:gluconolactonase [Sphingomonas paeninsulae]AYJ85637.1 gluconolactonase [Sphingomonas paeninsulae]
MLRTAFKMLLVSIGAATLVSAGPAPTYVASGSIAGPDGGWDYASVDGAAHRLYVAHGNTVLAVDLAHSNTIRLFGAIARAHAVVPIPGKSMLLVTSGHDNSVRLLDTGDGHELAQIAVGNDPDAAFYDPATGHAMVMNAKSGTVSIIDVATRKVIRTITLKPALEFGVLGNNNMLYVNNEDLNEIESANLTTGKIGAAIPLPGCTGPTGLGFDGKTGQLISACANGKAALVSVTSHKMVALLPIGSGPDAVIMDMARRTAIIPNGRDGTLSIIALDAAGGAKVVSTAKSEVGARTGALNPADGMLYLPTAHFSPPATAGARPAAIPGSFHVAVMSRH